jgi:phosphatidylserine decarboxylase
MWQLTLANWVANLVLWVIPSRWSDRIRANAKPAKIYQLSSGRFQPSDDKPSMTLFEAVFATLLFDLALFGTDNWFINNVIIARFTKFQNNWDKTFASQHQDAQEQVFRFCDQLQISTTPWMWDRPAADYTSLNDFFTRKYHDDYCPAPCILVSSSSSNNNDKSSPPPPTLVSPASCKMSYYSNHAALKELCIKGCSYELSQVGIPNYTDYQDFPIVLGYLSPRDYHRVHAPISGRVIHCHLEGANAHSASVKFWSGPFNLLGKNKRLVVVLEDDKNSTPPRRVALVIVGGIGVNTIVYDTDTMGVGKCIRQGQEVATFRAGGSSVVVFSNFQPQYKSIFVEQEQIQKKYDKDHDTYNKENEERQNKVVDGNDEPFLIQVLVGETLTEDLT